MLLVCARGEQGFCIYVYMLRACTRDNYVPNILHILDSIQ